MSIRRNVTVLAAVALAFPLTVLPHHASAQTVFTQQQIIQKLRKRPVVLNNPQNVQPVIRQHNNQVVVKRRAPAPNGAVMMRVPQPVDTGGAVATRRAPQPQFDPQFNPQQGGVAEFRAPPPQGAVSELRAPPRATRAPSGGVSQRRAPQNVQVASTDTRGLDVRPVGTNYPDNGRIDLEILFDYDSAQIAPSSLKQLIILGEALNDAELSGARIVIAGHTDAAGSDGYNSSLSERRARSVFDFLVNYAGVDAKRLVPEGYGESLLKFPDAPLSGQNRRVEIINLGDAG